MKNFGRLLKQFNWRFLLVRLLVSTLALVITTALMPNIYFKQLTVVSILIVVLGLGILNALIKPIIQFLTLSFVFVTFGLVVAVINGLMLFLLSYLFPERFAVDSLFWALVGGALLWLLGSMFESMLGLTVPIIPEDMPELRDHVGLQTTTFTQLLLKARAERETGLMGEESTTVLTGKSVAGEIAATATPPDDGQLPSPPEATAAEAAGAEKSTSAGAEAAAASTAAAEEPMDAEAGAPGLATELSEPEGTLASITEQETTSPAPRQEQDS